MNDYVVYVHYRGDNDEPFYVGMGKPGRPFASGRNEDHALVEKLCGTSVEVVCEGLSKKAALEIEAELIAEFSKKFLLVNRACSEQKTKVFLTGTRRIQEIEIVDGKAVYTTVFKSFFADASKLLDGRIWVEHKKRNWKKISSCIKGDRFYENGQFIELKMDIIPIGKIDEFIECRDEWYGIDFRSQILHELAGGSTTLKLYYRNTQNGFEYHFGHAELHEVGFDVRKWKLICSTRKLARSDIEFLAYNSDVLIPFRDTDREDLTFYAREFYDDDNYDSSNREPIARFIKMVSSFRASRDALLNY